MIPFTEEFEIDDVYPENCARQQRIALTEFLNKVNNAIPCVVVLRVFLGLFSTFEGEHLSRFIRENGRLDASEIGVDGFGLSEKR